jgi:hypothetical protein
MLNKKGAFLKKLRQSLLLALLLLTHTIGFSQAKYTFSNIKKAYQRNFGAIKAGDEVKGYYAFYVSDKVSRKVLEYTVDVMDENLNKVASTSFESSKYVQLLEAAFNGNAMIFYFYDSDNKTVEHRIYDMKCKLMSTNVKELTKKEKRFIEYNQRFTSDDGENKTIFEIPNKGFISVLPDHEGKKYNYEVNYFSSEKKNKVWAYNPEEEEKYAFGNYLGATDSIALIEVTKADNKGYKNSETFIVGLDLNSGKRVFETKTSVGTNKVLPMNVSILQGESEFLVFGTYFEQETNIAKGNNLGLAALKMNSKGKITKSKFNSWEGDLSKYLDVNEKGKVEDFGYLYFHNLIQTDDGRIYAVAEGFKKTASALGIAGAILGGFGGSSNVALTNMTVTDMMVIEFTPEFKVKDVKRFEKNKNKIELPSGAEFASPQTIAHLIKYYFGGFDYAFTTRDKSHSIFSVCYSDYEKTKEYKGLAFHSITYDGSKKLSKDRVALSTKAYWISIYQAKPGYIMVAEYFKKEKEISLRLEKIN